MSFGALCFGSSGSNGGCWVVFVVFLCFFLGKKCTHITPEQNVHANYAQKRFCHFFPYTIYTKSNVHTNYAKKEVRGLCLFSNLSSRLCSPF